MICDQKETNTQSKRMKDSNGFKLSSTKVK